MKERFYRRYSGLNETFHGGTPVPEGMLDFSISVNPFPLPESVSEAYGAAWEGLGRYPDSGCEALKSAVSECFGIEPERLLMTNGSAEAFSLIASSFLDDKSSSMIVLPGYGDYEKVIRTAGAEILKYSLSPDGGFEVDGRRMMEFVQANYPDIIWLCSPNNPTGVIIPNGLICDIASAAASRDGLVVLDEAYASFASSDLIRLPGNYSNLIRVRSMTKDFGIPGLRLGWVEASPEIIRILNLNRPCWSVNYPAQRVGISLLGNLDYFAESWDGIKTLRDELIRGLEAVGIDAEGASRNECGVFIFFKPPEGIDPALFLLELEKAGIRLRDCESMGAPGYFRAGVRLRDDNQRLIHAAGNIIRQEIGL